MSNDPINREAFVLRIAVTDDPSRQAYTLNDTYPCRGNIPELFCRNDDVIDAVVTVQTSPDRVTWTDLSFTAVVKKGRAKLSFTTSVKYVRFVVNADTPAGVHCELVQFATDPAYQAGV